MKENVKVKCPHCNKEIVTALESITGNKLDLTEDEIRVFIDIWLSKRHGVDYDGILARDLAKALIKAKDKK